MQNELKVWRARRRLNQRQAAAVCGLRYHRYMAIENETPGCPEPTSDEQGQLASGFACRMRDLFPRGSKVAAASAA